MLVLQLPILLKSLWVWGIKFPPTHIHSIYTHAMGKIRLKSKLPYALLYPYQRAEM